MANEQNLKRLTPKQARELGAKGGKASAESKRKKKLLKECMLELLDLPPSKVKDWNALSKMGIDPENIDNRALLTAALFNKAVYGDVSAFKEIRNLIGEDNTSTEDTLKKLDEVLEKIDGVI